ncbi:MAG: putative Acyl-CoA dehydrogenase, short-chain specific [Actinomycetia bacterium]|nr:putative Acyl-CoA dehydrogenase, short-chain specific [Actinomycetes bacterium]
MTTMDAQTRALLSESLRELLGTSDRAGTSLSGALAELGWDEVLAEDPATATTLLFREHGRALARSRALDDVLLAELAAVLPAAPGVRALVHPLPGATEAAPPTAGGRPLSGLLLGPLDDIAELVVPVPSGPDSGPGSRSGTGTGIITVPAAAVRVTPVATFDRDLSWFRVQGEPTGPARPSAAAGPAWDSAVTAGRRALAAEMIGACAGALALAAEHTTARVQFGHPIASFQAVRHRLAEAHVALVAAEAALAAAWADGGGWAAAVAKATAGRMQAVVSRHVLQVCGAMGLMEEYGLRRYVTRAAVLDTLYGPHQDLEETIGAALLGGMGPPRIAEF